MKIRFSSIRKWLLIGGSTLLFVYILNLNSTIRYLSAKPSGLIEVYYASQNIPLGTRITKDMLGTFSIPLVNVSEVMFTKGEEENLVSSIAKYNLDQGTLITSSMVGLMSVDGSVLEPGIYTLLATRPIAQGALVTSDDVSGGIVPSISPNSVSIFYRDPSEITGCRAKMDININEPVTKNMLIDCPIVQTDGNQSLSPKSLPTSNSYFDWRYLISALFGAIIFESSRYAFTRYRKKKSSADILTTVSIVVSSIPISKGVIVERSMVTEISFPRKNYMSSMVTSLDDVVGKILMFSIGEGVVLTKSMILDVGDVSWNVNNSPT
jgi:flagella basal body P-ring formation protein FlgA